MPYNTPPVAKIQLLPTLMEELDRTPREHRVSKSKIFRTISGILICVIGLVTGAAIVHGLVVGHCIQKHDFFVAGVVPADVQVPKADETDANAPVDLQNCLNDQHEQPLEAGILPSDSGRPIPESSVQGFTKIEPLPTPDTSTAQLPGGAILQQTQTSAPAPVVQTTPTAVSQPAPEQQTSKPEFNPTPVVKPSPAVKPTTTPKSAKTIGVDLDKLSMAVAMTETHNCQDTRGSALLNNCHGIKKNGKFVKFASVQASHDYFKQLWAKSYKIFPTTQLAKIYSGNDRPTTWLNSVKYYYYNL